MSFGGTNLDQGYAYNRRLVLEAIRVHGALSRAEITRLTGLAPQTISNIINSLVDMDLLIAERRHGSVRGQPPTDLRLNPQGGYAFGISIDNHRLYAVLVDLSGNCLSELEEQLHDISPENVLPRLAAAIITLKARASVPAERILGTGIVMTGLTTHGSFIGLAPDEVTSRWRGFPLESELNSVLAMPIFTDNDARAAAVGEALYGQGRRFRDFVYIYFGVGVGGGILHSGQPFRGTQGRAGEFGHIIVDPGGRLCSCGNRGCLEQYASVSSALGAIECKATGIAADEALTRAFNDRDERLMSWLDSAAVSLRTAVANLENIFDPETILLGGIIPEVLLGAIIERIPPLPRTVSSRRTLGIERIVKSSFGPAIPAMGAASLALFDATTANLSLLFKKNAVPTAEAVAERRDSKSRKPISPGDDFAD
jgi:predicted NBD/HSP70 family sugar kinase